MPPKKKQKPNGFLTFMLEMKPRLCSEQNRTLSMAEVQTVCTPLWDNLTPEQKDVYNMKAKGVSRSKEEKFDARGVPLSWKENEERKQSIEKKEEFDSIEHMVSYYHQRNSLCTHVFYIAHFNHTVKTDENEYPPCEVGLIKFSLASGISENYHQFIHPDKMPVGYSFAAKQHAEESHMIPAFGFKLANSNYVEITDSIKRMIRQADGNLAPIFFLESDIPAAKWILNWLVEKSCQLDSNYDRSNPFRAYSLNKLFYELRRHADLEDSRLQFTSTAMVADKLCSGSYEYYPNMACQWHEEEDRTKFCSLSIVRSYAYNISDMCCENYGIRMLGNRHCPAQIADESKYEVKPPTLPEKKDVAEASSVQSDNDSSASEVPRLPRDNSHVIGPRLIPFASSGRGASRFASDQNTNTVASSPTNESRPASGTGGRGRGRGLLH